MLTATYGTPLNRAGIAVAGPYTGQPVRDGMRILENACQRRECHCRPGGTSYKYCDAIELCFLRGRGLQRR